MFATADSCHQEGSGSIFSWAALNTCTATQDECDGTLASFKYTKCSGGSVSQTEYSDTACAVQSSTNSRDLLSCFDSSAGTSCTGEPQVNPYPFYTMVCKE